MISGQMKFLIIRQVCFLFPVPETFHTTDHCVHLKSKPACMNSSCMRPNVPCVLRLLPLSYFNCTESMYNLIWCSAMQ